MSERGLIVLLLEDLDPDILFFKRAAAKISQSHHIHSVHNGEEAIAYLRGECGFADRKRFPLPHLILTDLKMPLMDGLDFLRWRQSNPRWLMVPTIMFSGSGLDEDIRRAYRSGANSYFTKPTDQTQLVNTLRSIVEYWGKAALPFSE
jgi:CheY-like chemotaxis protein